MPFVDYAIFSPIGRPVSIFATNFWIAVASLIFTFASAFTSALELSACLPRHSHTVTIIYGITYFIISNSLTVVASQQISPTECISVGVGLPRASTKQSPWFNLVYRDIAKDIQGDSTSTLFLYKNVFF